MSERGLCLCGCGGETTPTLQNNVRRGYIKGEPNRYIQGHSHRRQKSEEERFWDKVKKDNPNGCWTWLGAYERFGYGRFFTTPTATTPKREVKAHRYAYEAVRGPITDGLWVLHQCDNPPCVNPWHMRLGDHDQNMAEMVARGRSTKGRRRIQPQSDPGQAA